MKKILLAVFAYALLGLVLFLTGCSASPHESSKDAVEISNASVGDIVVFGDIRWIVTAKTETGCTLLCEKPVTKMPFNEAGYQTANTWDESTVREWLNEKFYNTFTEEETVTV